MDESSLKGRDRSDCEVNLHPAKRAASLFVMDGRVSSFLHHQMLDATPDVKKATEIVLSSRKTWKNVTKSLTEKASKNTVQRPVLKTRSVSQNGTASYRDTSNYVRASIGLRSSGGDWDTVNSPKSSSASHSPSTQSCFPLSSHPSPDADAGTWPKSNVPASTARPQTHVKIEIVDFSFPSSGSHGGSQAEPGSTFISLDSEFSSMEVRLTSWKNPIVSLRLAQPLEVAEHFCLFQVFTSGKVILSDYSAIMLQSVSIQTREGHSEKMYYYDMKFFPRYWNSVFSFSDFTGHQILQQIIRRKSIDLVDSTTTPTVRSEDQVVHTISYAFVTRQRWKGSEEAAKERIGRQSIGKFEQASTSIADTLGLDAPSCFPEPECPSDGRAHFPVQDSLEVGSSQPSTEAELSHTKLFMPSIESNEPNKIPLSLVKHTTNGTYNKNSLRMTAAPSQATTVDPYHSNLGQILQHQKPEFAQPSQVDPSVYLNPSTTSMYPQLYPNHSSTFQGMTGWAEQDVQQQQSYQPTPAPQFARYESQYFWRTPAEGYSGDTVSQAHPPPEAETQAMCSQERTLLPSGYTGREIPQEYSTGPFYDHTSTTNIPHTALANERGTWKSCSIARTNIISEPTVTRPSAYHHSSSSFLTYANNH
ncbi:hypothetical protein GYMLUDRAFT_252506 [Collybiopsis luxurians FD-317 M1]|uniref:Uncharacterized protein n=1 Tax=Collybiopsis luxurians FD-317 M1 TaxID=944289 RepID=A0A0D0B9N1_9AGAR|nr:hypothetical protein GYMLUDRAFT_252506 [Collybiopsis luxurians FD-317 M1]